MAVVRRQRQSPVEIWLNSVVAGSEEGAGANKTCADRREKQADFDTVRYPQRNI